MKPPSPTWVGPFRYETELTSMDDSDDVGTCLDDQGAIRVHNRLAPLRERETYLHEHLHAIVNERGLDLGEKVEEKVVKAFGIGVLALLRDNPKLVAYLTEAVP